jgi:imidazolonepropionase-like amidohydrolase
MKIIKHVLLILIIFSAWNCSRNERSNSVYTVLTGATILDGTGNAPIEDGVIVIEGDRIKELGPADKINFPTSAKIIDLKGKFITPGFIDLHIHFWESGRTSAQPTFIIDLRKFFPYEDEVKFMKERISITLEKYLCAGVTSTVALGAIGWEYEIKKHADTTANAPRVFLAGGFVANYPTELKFPTFDGEQTGYWVEKKEDAAKLIRYLDSTGVDLIKAGYVNQEGYPLEGFVPKLEALIDESHKNNYRVSVHATELSSALEALKAGADVLAHTVADSVVDDEFIRQALRNNAVITSSLGVISSYNEILTSRYSLTAMDSCCGDPLVIESWKAWSAVPEDQKPAIPEWILKSEQSLAIMLENTKKAYDAGILICVGSDGGNIGSLHGPSFHRELRLLEAAGLKPMDILLAATKNGAIAIGKQHELGTLEKGKLADLLVIEADPLEDVNNYSRITYVMKSGILIERKSLTEEN